MTSEEALTRLIEGTAEAVLGVLEALCPGAVKLGGVSVEPSHLDPLGALPAPIVASTVHYVDGVTGGNVFALPLEGARTLAAAMMESEPPADGGEPELSELELSAVAEAMNQMMAVAAAATTTALGEDVRIGPPEVAVHESSEAVLERQPEAAHLGRAQFTIAGAPARLLQLIPTSFVVRMTRALDELETSVPDDRSPPPPGPVDAVIADSLRGVPVRLWPELGRAQIQTGRLVGLPAGAVVELDHRADDPVDVYVNGLRFGTGRLIVVDGGEWALQIESVAWEGAS